jgi:iron complex transport system substrate-binding protein
MLKKQALLILVILSLTLAGCGGKSQPVNQPTQAAAVETEEAKPDEKDVGETPDNSVEIPVASDTEESDKNNDEGTQEAKAPSVSVTPTPAAPTAPVAQPTKFRLVESDGTVFERDTVPQRIVILSVPTAIIMDTLGIELVGITMTSRTLPPRLADLPEAGMPRDPNIEVIKSLNADLVIISTDFKQMNKAKMEQHNIPTYYISNQLYEDTFKSIEILGKAFGKEAEANQLIRDMRARENQVLNAAKGKPAPKVLILFGTADSFLMQKSNTYAGNLVAKLGGINISDQIKLSEVSTGNIPLNIEQVVALNPDIIFRISHGTAEETQQIYDKEFATNPIWNAVSAHKNNRVYDLPMNLFFSNSGLQVIDSLEHLAKLMYP